jgi:hypothetical protein
MKNRILLDNYYLPGDLERQIGAFVEHYNHVRYHESINLTPRRLLWQRRSWPNVSASTATPMQIVAWHRLQTA